MSESSFSVFSSSPLIFLSGFPPFEPSRKLSSVSCILTSSHESSLRRFRKGGYSIKSPARNDKNKPKAIGLGFGFNYFPLENYAKKANDEVDYNSNCRFPKD